MLGVRTLDVCMEASRRVVFLRIDNVVDVCKDVGVGGSKRQYHSQGVGI